MNLISAQRKILPFQMTALVLLILVVPFISALGQTGSQIGDLIEENRYAFTYNGSFSGKGWDLVLDTAKRHKYFLLGEDHGSAEIPVFTKALIEHLDYDLFVTEIDSVTASILKQLALKDTAEINSFRAKNPSALSFYSAREEFDAITGLIKSGSDIWGLDQVSLFSTGIVLRRLEEVFASNKAKELSSKLANLSDTLFKRAVETGNYDTLFILSSKQEVFDGLREVLKDENREAWNLFHDIENSWKIYNGVDGANYRSRIGGMKSKLLNYYFGSQAKQIKYRKVLYKFGAYHISKAESLLGGFDVGNLLSNLAHAEGTSSYHLMIVGRKGAMNTFLPTKGMDVADFNIDNKKSPLHGLLPFAKGMDEKNWVFFDLKALRGRLKKKKLKIEDGFLKKTIGGYDGLIIIPSTTPSKN